MASLRETLEAAASGVDAPAGGDPPAPVDTGPIDTGPSVASTSARDSITGEPLATTESEAKALRSGDRQRDDSGKFIKSQADHDAPAAATAAAPETPTTESEPAQAAKPADPPSEEPIRVPASLPAPLKAKFSTLPEDVRAAFVKLDEDRTAAKAQWDQKAAQFNRLEEILAPRREANQLRGLDDSQAIQVLYAAQDLLDRDPMAGLRYLAQSYGVDLRQFGQQPAGDGQGGQPQPQPNLNLDAALQPILQKVTTLEQQLAQKDLQRGLNEVEAFRADPKHLYFDNVLDDITVLLESGRAKDLADAYEKATWANPEIRSLLLQQQAEADAAARVKADAEAKAKADADARAKATAAQRAGGSVTGAPGSAVQPPAGSRGSLRQDLLAAFGGA